MKLIMKFFLILSLSIPLWAEAVVLPGLFDEMGNPLHTADEVNVSTSITVVKNGQGYQYTYVLKSLPTSVQDIWAFSVQLPAANGVVLGSTNSPWGTAGYPNDPDEQLFVRTSPYTVTELMVGWAIPPSKGDVRLLLPGGQKGGFTFISPYPPSLTLGYVEGVTPYPAFLGEAVSEDVAMPFHRNSSYGPGKIIPVIGPVKPAVVGGSNYTVLSCAGLLCSVQISALGPQDPYGATYTYAWTGAFGTATGANPVVSLPVGTYPVQLSISDATGVVLVSMTQHIVVPMPAIAAITPAQLAALTAAQQAAFVAQLTAAQAAALTPVQVAALIGSFTPAQVASLTPAQLVVLTPAQVTTVAASLTPAQLASLTPMQMRGANEGDKEHAEEDNK